MEIVPMALVALSLVTGWSGRCAAIPDAEQLRRIELETAVLEQKSDVSIAEYLGKDWVCDGAKRLGKTEFIQNVKQNFATHPDGVNPYTIEKKNIEVHLFGETAVVTYVKEYRQVPDGAKGFAEEDTDVFTHDTAGWLLRFTKIMPARAQSRS
jgi:hypothetical protein